MTINQELRNEESKVSGDFTTALDDAPMHKEINEAIQKLIEARALHLNGMVEKQLCDAIEQAIRSGDFVRYVMAGNLSDDGLERSQVVYMPFRVKCELEAKIERLKLIASEALGLIPDLLSDSTLNVEKQFADQKMNELKQELEELRK